MTSTPPADVATWDATRLAAAIRAEEISSRDLLEVYLERIERINPALNAVVALDVDGGRQAATDADDDAVHGRWRGPLHGLPITIKDAIEVGGIRSTGGAVELAEHVPTRDAPAVVRLKAAGAIVFGKTNVPRWSGDLQTYNKVYGTTNNPWAVDRVSGGSSGGSAVAVAAGLTAFELGTDISGSVRIPSHCCGVFGLKPSYGVVPQHGYLDHVGGGTTAADINVFGPLARSAQDLDLLLGVLAGPEPDRELAWRIDLPAPRRDTIAGSRVGVWFGSPACPVDPDELALLRRAAGCLADAGAEVTEAHPPFEVGPLGDLYITLLAAAVSPTMPDDIADAISGSHRAWLRADEARARARAEWARWFESYDVLLCPVLPLPAFPHQQEGDPFTRTINVNGLPQNYLDLVTWLRPVSVLGLPSAVPPIGRTPAGLPVGVQVVTAYLRDREAVQMAGLLAGLTGGGYKPPPGC